MNTSQILEKIQQDPSNVEFSELMDVIENEYDFRPTSFTNGQLKNAEDENMGSCKVFSFAQLHDLTADQTLACFGSYYRQDVLQNPKGTDHQNIRNFQKTAWNGVIFNKTALKAKKF